MRDPQYEHRYGLSAVFVVDHTAELFRQWMPLSTVMSPFESVAHNVEPRSSRRGEPGEPSIFYDDKEKRYPGHRISEILLS